MVQAPQEVPKGSIVWKALVEAFLLIGQWTAWRVGNGCRIRIGEDPWIGVGDDFKFFDPLL
jgi:hypothetical protein